MLKLGKHRLNHLFWPFQHILLTRLKIANYIVALTTPIFIDRTTFGAYYFFASWGFLCTIVCFLFMFETKGHSLEYIEQSYMDGTAKATGRWTMDGFKLRTVATVNPLPVTTTEESDGRLSD